MPVIFTPEAQAHLDEIFDYIAEASPIAAHRFVTAIVDYCMTFELFPQRGTKRDDLRAGFRTVGFRRRVTIVFSLSGDAVTIVAVFYGGRNLEALFSDNSD
jgi:toxin ParE1/3/4